MRNRAFQISLKTWIMSHDCNARSSPKDPCLCINQHLGSVYFTFTWILVKQLISRVKATTSRASFVTPVHHNALITRSRLRNDHLPEYWMNSSDSMYNHFEPHAMCSWLPSFCFQVMNFVRGKNRSEFLGQASVDMGLLISIKPRNIPKSCFFPASLTSIKLSHHSTYFVSLDVPQEIS